MSDSFKTSTELSVGGVTYRVSSLAALAKQHPALERLPYSLKVLLENLLRNEDGRVVKAEDVATLADWDPRAKVEKEIAFHPARVLMQDFTGVPAVVDLAAMREAVAALGGDPEKVNPLSPADLVIDHSVQVDDFASSVAFGRNVSLEYERNRERYAFLRWGQNAFKSFRVVPPGTGICHQVNLEYLARVVWQGADGLAYPDTLVGTDSHTTMINGLGVLGWGVGGIEAEAALLGQPVSMLIPEVVGFRLHGTLPEGATATDLVLTVTQMLRKKGVVGKFVEFYGPGVAALSLTDRATIANMAPEYGATMGFFPVDSETLAYLKFTGRGHLVPLVEAYCRHQGLFRTDDALEPVFSDTLDLDLGTVEPSLAGPRRPQDRVPLKDSKKVYRASLKTMLEKDAASVDPAVLSEWLAARDGADPSKLGRLAATVPVGEGRLTYQLPNGAVVIAAITSCTNTSNPSVLLGAGLLAKKAVERGLDVKPWVKTSLAPGSKVVTDYLRDAGLLPYLEALGFHLVGYGCTTCIGNSGPLPEKVSEAVRSGDLVVAAVLSGNRNFEGRVNPQVKMNYLASPPLVVAYALAGEMDVDLGTEPLGRDRNGNPVFLADVWPTPAEVKEAMARSIKPEQFTRAYGKVFEGDEAWRGLPVPTGKTFAWEGSSTYVRKPPFFEGLTPQPPPLADVRGARCLAVLGDSVTTDHISPAGNIAKTSPAAKYLTDNGVTPAEFNQYGARRGNHEVMMRGTFANIRLKNLMLPGTEGGVAVHLPSGEQGSIYDVSMRYQGEKVPLVVLGGAEYGTGSSRDWAAKGTMLLGVKAVVAKSFERIHRSNLAGMGVLPLQFQPGEDAASLGLTGRETFDVGGIAEGLTPMKKVAVTATAEDGSKKSFAVTVRLDTPNEVDYYHHGGILPFVLRQLAAK
ncbi:MAG: aconitate hydratase AcnA [Acidobacteria bacterium]|nr:MAG: aconitate hydratase AcnA [Acidobacteriota bacterium]MCE7956500.1 aconitate hydratase AcnA [Acidobacteria bacterium ACB2]